MSLRSYLSRIERQKSLILVNEAISKKYEISGVLKSVEPSPVRFDNVIQSAFPVIGNLFCTKGSFADYLGITVSQIIPTLSGAIQNRSPYQIIENGPCQEVVHLRPDLNCLPILKHVKGDGGPYITSGVVITKHPAYGQNIDFHRCMQISPTEMAMRVVGGRHFDRFLNDLQELDVAICVGCPPNVLVAAATSVEVGVDELEIANTLEPVQAVRAKTVDLHIPVDAEFVLEGTVYLDRRNREGPFVDLTGTMDIIRQEPTFEVKAITHRHNAVWHALVPGGLEHKLLMGMPREPTIYQKVNKVVECLDVHVNPGGSSWLHAIVKIRKHNQDDGLIAIQAAFAGHRSCKHVFIVDQDIDIYDPQAVEWAFATRFQGDRQMVVLDKEPGSSLDPSAEPGSKLTTKIGFDLTIPFDKPFHNFSQVPFPSIDLDKFIKGSS